ncbi:SOS response-associated peptidase [Bacillus atrophaeus]|uniref:SOS response-associated peptidase n=1 Tax=Bacillus atrophaeus TaxID=1452 RepID=UPI002280220D|nr:SOS response-associated peptidase [Bacillus atrophaeus]MCY8917384.1 SOS response-associated peptidase [Bacillus atrophaeus]MCY8924984.1 SOS response-associated peptidase [Bacillus atrophaeus]
MCGRFTLFSEFDDILEQFDIDQFLPEDEYDPSYNVAPSQNILTINNDGSSNRLGKLRWGLIPPWAKDEKIGYKMINARAETLAEKSSFRKPLISNRCIIPADSFYEWKRLDPKTKIPMRIKLKSTNLFAFAGLYEKWNSPQGNPIYSCTIITTKPNELMEDIHDRMPVILPHDNQTAWLNPQNTDAAYLQSLLLPYDADDMEAYQVSSLVNSPKNNSPELLESH